MDAFLIVKPRGIKKIFKLVALVSYCNLHPGSLLSSSEQGLLLIENSQLLIAVASLVLKTQDSKHAGLL